MEKPNLAEQDGRCVWEAYPDEDNCPKRGAMLRGIQHERRRMRLALDELLFRGPHCGKSDLLLAVRKHLGLEEPK